MYQIFLNIYFYELNVNTRMYLVDLSNENDTSGYNCFQAALEPGTVLFPLRRQGQYAELLEEKVLFLCFKFLMPAFTVTLRLI